MPGFNRDDRPIKDVLLDILLFMGFVIIGTTVSLHLICGGGWSSVFEKQCRDRINHDDTRP